MNRPGLLIFITLIFLCAGAAAQDTLPRFSVVQKSNNRSVISWTNNYRSISQISIQRSFDSTRNFKTIITVPDPTVEQNGFVDTRPAGSKVYYRLFIVLDSGKYQFSASKSPAPDTASGRNEPALADNQRMVMSDSLSHREVNSLNEKLKPTPKFTPRAERFFMVKAGTAVIRVSEKNIRKFKDSVLYTTRDTLVFKSLDTAVIHPFAARELYRASKYVFTEKYGNVMLQLPDAPDKKYSISFFDNDRTPLFEINEVQSPSLIVDKSNFVHAGWFWFELYEDGKLKERHRFYIPKEF